MSKGGGFAYAQTVQNIERQSLTTAEKDKQLAEAQKVLEADTALEKAKEQRNKDAIEKAAIARAKLLKKQSGERAARKVKDEKKVTTTTKKPNWTIIIATSIIVIISIMFFIFMFRSRQSSVAPTIQQQFRLIPQQLPRMPQQFVQMPRQIMRGGAKDMNKMIKFIKSLFG